MEEEKKKKKTVNKKNSDKENTKKTTKGNTKKVTETKKTVTKKVTETKKPIKKMKEIEDEKISKDVIVEIKNNSKEKNYSVLQNYDTNNEIDLKGIFKNKFVIFSFILGILLGILVMVLVIPKGSVTLKDGTKSILSINGKTITAENLYEDLKSKYAINSMLNLIDNKILSEKFETTEEATAEVKSTADYYIEQYTTYYNYTKEEFLNENGFKDYDDFINYLSLDYKRNQYFEEYLSSLVTDEKINTYYNESVFGDINAKYIKVAITQDDDKDTKLIEEILTKLSKGQTYDSIKDSYGDKITATDLSYVTYKDSTDEKIKTELLKLSNNSHSSNYIELADGYAIIFRLDQKEKVSLDSIKEDITTILKNDITTKDQNIMQKALIQLRKDNKLQISDNELKAKYDEYCNSINNN